MMHMNMLIVIVTTNFLVKISQFNLNVSFSMNIDIFFYVKLQQITQILF